MCIRDRVQTVGRDSRLWRILETLMRALRPLFSPSARSVSLPLWEAISSMLTFSSPAHRHLRLQEVSALYSRMLIQRTRRRCSSSTHQIVCSGLFLLPPFRVETKHFPSSECPLAAQLFQESASL